MLDLNLIKAITIDLDDTLWPVWPAIERAEKALENWLHDEAPMTAAIFANPTARHEVREMVARARPELKYDLSAIRREAIRMALDRSGEDATLADAAFNVFFDERNRVELFDDVISSLDFLSSRYPVVALSNGNADVVRIGIGQYFKAAINAQQFGVGKPDARIFHAAAGAAGVLPAEVLHVGDDVLLDVLAALNCGMQTAWVNRGEQAWPHPEMPHETVTTLTELCDLMRV